MEDKCYVCGQYVPEGRQICPSCEYELKTYKAIKINDLQYIK
jgi:predicted nucleic acid-binding Zn ribbon protein